MAQSYPVVSRFYVDDCRFISPLGVFLARVIRFGVGCLRVVLSVPLILGHLRFFNLVVEDAVEVTGLWKYVLLLARTSCEGQSKCCCSWTCTVARGLRGEDS